jgi:hypothetical protein
MKMAVFWDVASRILVETVLRVTDVYCLHHKGDRPDEGSKHIRNADQTLWDCKAQHPRRLKLSHYTPRRRLGERRYSSYSFTTSALNREEWSASRPGCASPPGKGPPVPIVQEAGRAPEPIWTQTLEEKSFHLCRVLNLDHPRRQPSKCAVQRIPKLTYRAPSVLPTDLKYAANMIGKMGQAPFGTFMKKLEPNPSAPWLACGKIRPQLFPALRSWIMSLISDNNTAPSKY